VIQHAEDTRLTRTANWSASMNAGPTAFTLGLRGMSDETESAIVERDIRLVTELRETRAHLHVAHISTAAALNAVRQARRGGLHVTCEVAPHHFLLTDEHVGLYSTNAKMCPPLRSAADRDALIEGLIDGVVDAISTDHAPHAVHEKEVEFERAPNGVIGLETAFGLALRWLHAEWHLPLGRVLSLMSAQPAAILGIRGRGTLAVGSFADVVVFDPKAEWTYNARQGKSKARNTPFDGWQMQGRIRWTISEGRIAYNAEL
jgi:dihydroorotase